MDDSVLAHLPALSGSENSNRGDVDAVRGGGGIGGLTALSSVVSVMASALGKPGSELRGEIRRKHMLGRTALRRAPDRVRKMRIALEARDDVPMQMGYDVA